MSIERRQHFEIDAHIADLGVNDAMPVMGPNGTAIGRVVPPIDGHTTVPIEVVPNNGYVTLDRLVMPGSSHPGLRDPSVQERLLSVQNDYMDAYPGAHPVLDRDSGDIRSVNDVSTEAIKSAAGLRDHLSRHELESKNILRFVRDRLNE